ncbi:MAG: MFS transporter [Candidatus Nanopelagicales bacterium]
MEQSLTPAGLVTADPQELERLRVQSRTLKVVVFSQILGGAGLAAGVAVGALLAQQMLGSDSLAGLPIALFTLGSALAAFLIGRFTQRWGRRTGLSLGFAVGGLGAAGVVLAAVTGNIATLMIALFIYGAGTAANLQARYAGTDLALPAERGRAVSIAMVATTLGAVAGPNLIEPLGRLALSFGIPALAGPFLLAAISYLAAAATLFAFLRPDPYVLAERFADVAPPLLCDEVDDETVSAAPTGVVGEKAIPTLRNGVVIGATVMVLTQIAMVAIMTMTPVHMREHSYSLTDIGLVISIHVAAMFLPSPITGILVDRVGRIPMSIAGAVTLLLAGVVAAMAPTHSLVLLIVALTLLGLGWNFGVIAGTALVVDSTPPDQRGRTQGSIDVLVALAGAGGGAASGIVMAATGYSMLALLGGVLSLLLIPVLWWTRRRTPSDR